VRLDHLLSRERVSERRRVFALRAPEAGSHDLPDHGGRTEAFAEIVSPVCEASGWSAFPSLSCHSSVVKTVERRQLKGWQAPYQENRVRHTRRENKGDGREPSSRRRKRRESKSPHHVREATKGLRWMPWRQVPKKDAGHCEKPREAVYRRRSEGIRMGKPTQANPGCLELNT
jgi:hypothetical protein